jgi:translation initiation factor 2D
VLPLPSSTLVSTHLNPYLPETFSQLTFKKTSWKKAATFLKKYLEKEGLVKTKDRGGETVVMSINWNHKLIAEFQPYHLSSKENVKTAQVQNEDSSQMPSQQLQIKELYKPSGKVLRAILEAQSKSCF